MFVVHTSVWDLIWAVIIAGFMLFWFALWIGNAIQSYRSSVRRR
jgi:VIT1/CCC1 family predicted Fe2+/Mn2+ transporter